MIKQKGYMVLLAIIFIFVMGVMGTLIAYMFAGRAQINAAVYQGYQAFYVAESGLEAATRYVTRPSLNSSPTRIACGSVSGYGQLTGATIGPGQFTATASAPSVLITTLSSGITASATTISVASTASFPAQGRIMIDLEKIDYAGISGNTFIGVTRGADSTMASSHASGTAVGQYQCSLNVNSGVPSMSTATYQRTLSRSVQLQDGWIIGARSGNNYTIYRWNGGTELAWTDASFNGGSDRENLNDVAMTSYGDAWAVGLERSNNFLILRWNGSTWSKSLVAGACSNQDLNGVTVVSKNEAWAVGQRYQPGCSGGQRRYTVLYYNGSGWSLLTPSTSPSVPSDSNQNRDLYAVHVIDTDGDGAGNIGFAVGANGDIIRYNGSNWVDDTSGTNRALRGVYVVSSSEAWVVGNNGEILRWNGSGWSGFSSPTGVRLNSISMLDTDNDGLAEFGVAVGENGWIITYNGSSWSSTKEGNNDFDAVYVLTTSDVWVTGQNGTVAHYDGSSWNTSSIYSGELNGIAFANARFKPASSWKQTFN